MKAVDEAGFQIIANNNRAAANPNVFSIRNRYGLAKRFCRCRADEMEGRAPFHLDGGPGIVGENEDRAPEGWLVSPPAAPVRIVRKVMEPEHARAHDLGTDINEIGLRIFVVDASRSLAAFIVEHALTKCSGFDIGADET